MRRLVQVVLGFVVGALFLWLTLRQVDMGALGAALRGIVPAHLLAAPLLLGLGYLCRIQRWRSMLLSANAGLGLGRTAVAFVGSIAVNNLLPLRAGDALRAFGFTRWLGVGSGAVVASVLVERLLDMMTLILALAFALWAFALDGDAVGIARAGAGALGAVGLVSLILLARPGLLALLFDAMARVLGLFGEAMGKRAGHFALSLRTALGAMSGRALPALIGWSVLVWLFEGAAYWAVASAVPALIHPEAAWLAMPVGTLSTLLPSTPGHVGTFDYFTQLATAAVGNPLAAATGFALVTHAMLWLTTTLIGGGCLVIWVMLDRDR